MFRLYLCSVFASNQTKSLKRQTMAFILLGAICLLVFLVLKSVPNPNLAQPARFLKLGGAALVLLGLLSCCFVQIEPGTVGVKKLFGKIQDGNLTEGLNFVNPLMDVTRFNTRTQNYTMSAVHDEGDKQGDDAIRILSSDGLEVEIDVTVLYKISADRAVDVLRSLGTDYQNLIVRPIARTKIRDYAVYYDAVSLYSTKREEFQLKIFQSIEKEFLTRGLILDQILIRNINLPKSVKASIESKINAEQEAQKMKFVLDKERQEADRKRLEAQGISDYQRILNASLSDKLLQFEQIKAQKELALSTNAKVIVMSGKGNTPVLIGQ
jgi:regulator of protease activity HflC (stomatin/prohibitin superfamily)